MEYEPAAVDAFIALADAVEAEFEGILVDGVEVSSGCWGQGCMGAAEEDVAAGLAVKKAVQHCRQQSAAHSCRTGCRGGGQTCQDGPDYSHTASMLLPCSPPHSTRRCHHVCQPPTATQVPDRPGAFDVKLEDGQCVFSAATDGGAQPPTEPQYSDLFERLRRAGLQAAAA